MPLIRLETTESPSGEVNDSLLVALTRVVAQGLGKSESSVMASIQTAQMLMAGLEGPAAFVEVRSIGGLNGEVNRAISSEICRLLEMKLSIAPERIYLNFVDVARADWGWNGKTFA